MTGKKAKDPKDWRTEYVQIRVSKEEKQFFSQAAKGKGVSVSDLIRSMILPTTQEEPTHQISTIPTGTKEITLPGYPGTFTVKD